jgi:UDPglucose 6-dehydrogenase
MWLVAREIGVDLNPIAATVARSAEGSINPQYGIRGGAPYGGVCLPKDTQGFLGFADTVGVDMPLLRAVVETNDKLAEIVDHEADIADLAADHAQLREAAANGGQQQRRGEPA